jgi:hypothetical protein
MSKTVRRITIALLLGLSLAPASHAAVSAVQQDLVPFTARLVELAVQFFWGDEKHGCTIDPAGPCIPQATTSTDSEHGCGIDPFGRPIGNCQGN